MTELFKSIGDKTWNDENFWIGKKYDKSQSLKSKNYLKFTIHKPTTELIHLQNYNNPMAWEMKPRMRRFHKPIPLQLAKIPALDSYSSQQAICQFNDKFIDIDISPDVIKPIRKKQPTHKEVREKRLERRRDIILSTCYRPENNLEKKLLKKENKYQVKRTLLEAILKKNIVGYSPKRTE